MKNNQRIIIIALSVIIVLLVIWNLSYYFKNDTSKNVLTTDTISTNGNVELTQVRDFLPNAVASIDLNSKSFTVTADQRLPAQEFQVTNKTIIIKGGKTLSLSDLKVNEEVYVRGAKIGENENTALLVYVTNDFHTEKVLIDSVNSDGTISAINLLPPQNRNKKITVVTTSDTIIKKGAGELQENRPIVGLNNLVKGDVATILEIGTDTHPTIDQGSFVAVSIDVISPYFCSYDGLTLKTPGCIEDNQNSTSNSTQGTNQNTSSNISVNGMKQYSDSNFGFSFYYPSSWTVQNSAIRNSYAGGSVQKSLTIGPVGASSGDTITIDEYYSPTREITIARDLCSPMSGSFVAQHRFYFDTNLHTWMVEVPAYTAQSERDGSTYSVPASTKAANVSQNTMGGLHMLGAGCSGYVIPLSAQNFLVYTYYSRNVGSAYGNIAKTITATDPSVATPVSTSEQIQTITNAGVLLDAIGRKVGEWHVTNEHVYNYLGNLVASANPSTFQLISKYSDDSLGVSYATDGARVFSGWLHGQVVDGADPATFVGIKQQYQIPYAQNSGRYGESFSSYDVSFSKDKSHVWYQSKLIPGADPTTFVVTGNTHVENSTGGYTLAHDARHTYGIDKKDKLTIDGVTIQ